MKEKDVVKDLRDRVRTSDFQIEIVRITQTDQLQSDTLPAELPRDLLFFYPKVGYLCAWCTMSGFILVCDPELHGASACASAYLCSPSVSTDNHKVLSTVKGTPRYETTRIPDSCNNHWPLWRARMSLYRKTSHRIKSFIFAQRLFLDSTFIGGLG